MASSDAVLGILSSFAAMPSPGPPMTIGNMRELHVRSLMVT